LAVSLVVQLAELKHECLSRGLEVKGNKQDLINRLQAYFDESGRFACGTGANTVVLGEEEQKPAEPPAKVEEPPEKSAESSSVCFPLQRMQKRAERFNVPVSLESKKAARPLFHFLSGLSADGNPTVNMDKLKERAQRFGLNVSSVSKKSEDDEKLKKRKERFGIVTSSAGAATTEDTEAKKRKRAERFGIV
uniref:SAP domain containing ribonucleoprotein n=1 Tax=Sphenodon punctatus TaxID=8508 RepID=A0A8D0HCJ2_SPHPU